MALIEWPRVAVCFLTFQRTEYALRTITSLCKNLNYPGIAWYVADDGSGSLHYSSVINRLKQNSQIVFGSHHEKLGPGKSWNTAIDKSLEYADIILWLEDDWELQEPLDIHPYVKLLQDREDIGMVRLGYLAIELDCTVKGYDGIHYLQMSKETQYAYSGNPSLRHRRYFDAYKRYPEDRNPGECEVWHDYDVREGNPEGPEIWWPTNLPNGGWSVFGHIGQEQSY